MEEAESVKQGDSDKDNEMKTNKWILIVVLPCILIIRKFFFPTNALFIKT
jgi:hypothetical protein